MTLLKYIKQQQLQIFPLLSRPKSKSKESTFLLPPILFSSSTEPNKFHKPELKLSFEELTKINLLIPRLCVSNHLTTAVHLTVTYLMTNPPPNSVSLSVLIHSLASEPELTRSMSLLTRLRHTQPAHSHLAAIAGMLISSYMKKGRPKDALKIYNWVRRPGSVCEVEPRVYGVLVNGFCRNGFALEGLEVLRDMLGVGLVPEESLKRRVFRSLLREARLREAIELDEALGCVDGENVKKVSALLDQMIANWTE